MAETDIVCPESTVQHRLWRAGWIWVEVEEPPVGSVVLWARAGLRARAKLMYLHPHPLSGPGLNRWFLFFLADLWQSHKRPLLWHEAKRLRPLLARAGEGGENRGELRRGRDTVEESWEGEIKSQWRITMDNHQPEIQTQLFFEKKISQQIKSAVKILRQFSCSQESGGSMWLVGSGGW